MAFKKFKTEKMLLASIAVLFLFLFANAFTKELAGINVSSAEETSGASVSGDGEESQENEDSQNNEQSQDNEGSQEEASQDGETSEPSVSSTQQGALNTGELSEKSLDQTSQQSVETEEVSEVSEPSVANQEVSEESIRYVEGYGEVVSKEGNVALVKQDERLFFLIPVEVESQVTLDDQGSVVDARKSFLNWLLSVFSF